MSPVNYSLDKRLGSMQTRSACDGENKTSYPCRELNTGLSVRRLVNKLTDRYTAQISVVFSW
jgi:hypothetical protein